MKSFSTPTPEPPTSQTKTTRPALTQFALGIKLFTGTQKAGALTHHVAAAALFENQVLPGYLTHEKTHKKPRRKNYSEGTIRPRFSFRFTHCRRINRRSPPLF
jgi:hypothetical protein